MNDDDSVLAILKCLKRKHEHEDIFSKMSVTALQVKHVIRNTSQRIRNPWTSGLA